MARIPTLFPWTIAAALAAAVAGAQVPEGWYVVSRAAIPGNGTGGISIMHPRTPNTISAITGVPAALVGSTALPGSGASSVTVEPGPSGRILAGNVPGSAGAGVEVFRMTLSGSAVTSTASYYLGTASSASGGVTQIADFGTFAVAAVNGMNSTAPLFGARLAYLDKSSTAVSPITTTGLPAVMQVNAIARAGPAYMPSTTLYIGANNPTMGTATVYQVPVPFGGTVAPALPFNYTGVMTSLAVPASGILHMTFDNMTGTNLWTYDPSTPTFSGGLLIPGGGLNAIGRESATYGYILAQSGGPTGYQLYGYHPVGSGPNPSFYVTVTYATSVAGTASSGVYTGLAWNPTPTTYGTATPGAGTYSWNMAEFELGMPFAGSEFTLRTSSSGFAPGWFAVSFAPASFGFYGVTVLVDPAQLIQLTPLYPGSQWVPMSSYMVPAAVGMTFYCQAFYFEPTGLAASEGLRFRVQ